MKKNQSNWRLGLLFYVLAVILAVWETRSNKNTLTGIQQDFKRKAGEE